jgi:hypothetical protein
MEFIEFYINDINEWQIAQVPIGHGAVTSSYKIIFEEVIEGGQSGLDYGMFIDDFIYKRSKLFFNW